MVGHRPDDGFVEVGPVRRVALAGPRPDGGDAERCLAVRRSSRLAPLAQGRGRGGSDRGPGRVEDPPSNRRDSDGRGGWSDTPHLNTWPAVVPPPDGILFPTEPD